jgi:hypothetical protein
LGEQEVGGIDIGEHVLLTCPRAEHLRRSIDIRECAGTQTRGRSNGPKAAEALHEGQQVSNLAVFNDVRSPPL